MNNDYKHIDVFNLEEEIESDFLSGALSSDAKFEFALKDKGMFETEYFPKTVYIKDLEYSEEVEVNEELKLFTIGNSAIVDAYDLSDLKDEELENAKKVILLSMKNIYPNYDFLIRKCMFPININGEVYVDGEEKKKEEVIYSTHVLLIDDYIKHIKVEKEYVKENGL